MKNSLSILSAILLLTCISCHQQPEQSAEDYQKEVQQKIAELDKMWFEAWENEDLNSAMSLLDEDFLNIFSFNLTWNKEEFREYFQEGININSIEDVHYKTVETVVDQNYAFNILLFKQKIINKVIQDTTYYDVRVMIVHKKQEDGNWKVFRLMGQHNPNL